MSRSWLLALVAPFVLGGCQSVISTEISVRSDGSADVVASVEFRGDIADRLASDTELRAELEETLRLRAPNLEVVEGGTAYRAKLDVASIAANADVTGIAGVQLIAGDGQSTVLVATARPTALEQAVIDSVVEEPDRDALVRTVAENTFLRVEIRFPGQVITSDAGVVDGQSVVYAESLADWPSGVLTATGSTESSGWWRLFWTLLPIGIVAGLAIKVRRR